MKRCKEVWWAGGRSARQPPPQQGRVPCAPPPLPLTRPACLASSQPCWHLNEAAAVGGRFQPPDHEIGDQEAACYLWRRLPTRPTPLGEAGSLPASPAPSRQPPPLAADSTCAPLRKGGREGREKGRGGEREGGREGGRERGREGGRGGRDAGREEREDGRDGGMEGGREPPDPPRTYVSFRETISPLYHATLVCYTE